MERIPNRAFSRVVRETWRRGRGSTQCLLFCLGLLSPCVSWAQGARPAPASEAPYIITQAEPRLSDEAALGVDGQSVVLSIVVETDGRVSEAVIVESSGAALDLAAQAALFRSRFAPANREGRAERARIQYRLHFESARPLQQAAAPSGVKTEPLLLPEVSEPPSSTEAPEELVVITGSKVPERVSEAVVATEVITRKEIEEEGMQNLEDVLFARPGIQVERTFRGTDLWIRGLEPRYSLILVDGMRPAGRIGGGLDLSRFLAERIERVEIVRGPSSALYGSEAIGGVVNMISREIEEPLAVDAELRLGSDDAYAGNVRAAGRPIELLGIEASLGRQFTPAFYTDNSEQTAGSQRRTDSVSGALDVGKSRGNRLYAKMDYTLVDLQGVDGGAGDALFDRQQLQQQMQASLRHRWERGKWYLLNTLSYSRFREQTLKDQRGSDALDSYEDSHEHLEQFSSTTDYSWSKTQRSTAGAEILLQQMRSPRLDEKGERGRYAVFAQHRMEFEPGKEAKVVIVPGARFDIDSQFGSQVSPKLALRVQPWRPWIFRAGYGRGFRAPSFQQLLLRFENSSVGYVVEGNPDLTAESAHGLDLSVAFEPSHKIRLFVAGFRNDLSDMIAVVTVNEGGGETTFSYDNLQKAHTQGLESQIIVEPLGGMAFTAGYTFTDTWDGEHERHLEGQAPHYLSARMRLAHDASELVFIARGSLKLGRPYYIENADGIEEETIGDPLAQVDLRLAKSFGRNFELFFGTNNLLNAGDEFSQLLPRQYYAGLRGRY